MGEEQGPEPEARATIGFRRRIYEHKVIQWTLAYLGAALALAQAQELVANAFDWPEVVGRAFIALLIVGLPIAITVAWYHGHRGLQQISAGELAIASGLVFIGAVFFVVALRPGDYANDGSSVARSASGSPAASTATPASEPAPGATRPVLPNSVAVLPLENLSPDPANGFYASSMHAEIISKLTQLKNLNVITRDSVLAYPAAVSRPPPERIAAELGVESIMVGTFQFSNGRIRVGVQLVDPSTRRNLWAEDYEGDFADNFAVQADIAMNVANALAAEFSASEQAAIEKRPTSSPEAYARFLEALSLADAGNQVERAHSLLDEAIAIDPTFAAAHGVKAQLYALSFATSVQGMGVASALRDELVRKVEEHAERALALQPMSPDARVALRTVHLLTWNWSEFRRDLDAAELSGFGVYDYWGLAWMGETGAAVRRAEQLLALNPKSPTAYVVAGHAYTYAGDPRSSATLRDAVQMGGGNAATWEILAFSEVASGNVEEALVALRTAERLFRANPIPGFLPEIAYAYSRIGRPDDARRVFDELEALPNRDDLGVGAWAVAHLAVGDHAESLRWLEAMATKARNRESDPGFISVMNLKTNYLRDPVLERPEFRAVLDRIRGD
jgi:TolB-like protein